MQTLSPGEIQVEKTTSALAELLLSEIITETEYEDLASRARLQSLKTIPQNDISRR